MTDLCAKAYEEVNSVSQVRDILNARDEGAELTKARWWANETHLLRQYLVTACWEAKPGSLLVPKNARADMASKPWQRIPVELRDKIINEMDRIANLSHRTMQRK